MILSKSFLARTQPRLLREISAVLQPSNEIYLLGFNYDSCTHISFRTTSVWKAELQAHFPTVSVRYPVESRFNGNGRQRSRTLGTSILDPLGFIPDLPDELSTLKMFIPFIYPNPSYSLRVLGRKVKAQQCRRSGTTNTGHSTPSWSRRQ